MHARRHISTAFAALTSSLVLASTVPAATFTVTTPFDSGPGTLRQAVLDANANAGADIINFDETVFDGTPTIACITGEMVITGPLTIEGPPNRVVLSGNLASRIFRIDDGTSSGITIVFRKLRFLFGRVLGAERGGAILVANENVSLIDCELYGNESQDSSGAIHYTGGVPSFLTLTRCTASQNNATAAGGVIGIYGICITTISDCSFTANQAGAGGAINQNAGGQIAITGSTFYANSATGSTAGAIFLNGNFPQSLIRNCTFSANQAWSDGGAICLGTSFGSSLTVQNSTIAENVAGTSGGGGAGGGGGGIANPFAVPGSGIINLTSCILWGNTAANPGPALLTPSTVNATACLIQSTVGVTTFGGDPFTFAHIGVDPKIWWLDYNGGLTMTHALRYGSPAIDNGQNPAGLTTDQRGAGYPRVIDGDCNTTAIPDIGAVEVNCLCPEDLNLDGTVGVPDLLMLINAWGPCGGCFADFNDDGLVGVPDLLMLINAWGPCQ